MREETAIKNCVSKCCHSPTSDLYSSYEIQKWLYRRRGYQRSLVGSHVDPRRRRVHRGFVFERRENPISGLKSYWRPLKDSEASSSGRTKNNSSHKVPVFWRKSESAPSTDSSTRCAVWQCYKRPTGKAAGAGKAPKSPPAKEEEKKKEKGKEKAAEEGLTKSRNNAARRGVRETSIQCQLRALEKPKAGKQVHNSTQTPEENASNSGKGGESTMELPEKPTSEEKAIEALDIREYMKEAEAEAAVTEEERLIVARMRQLKAEEEKEAERERRRQRRQFVDRGTRFARAFTVTRDAAGPSKCPACGHLVPRAAASDAEDDTSASDDDSRLDAVTQNAQWALERRAAIHQLFLLDSTDLERR